MCEQWHRVVSGMKELGFTKQFRTSFSSISHLNHVKCSFHVQNLRNAGWIFFPSPPWRVHTPTSVQRIHNIHLTWKTQRTLKCSAWSVLYCAQYWTYILFIFFSATGCHPANTYLKRYCEFHTQDTCGAAFYYNVPNVNFKVHSSSLNGFQKIGRCVLERKSLTGCSISVWVWIIGGAEGGVWLPKVKWSTAVC